MIRSTIGFIFSGARLSENGLVSVCRSFRVSAIEVSRSTSLVRSAFASRVTFNRLISSSTQLRMLGDLRCGTDRTFDRCLDTHPSNLLATIIAPMMIARDSLSTRAISHYAVLIYHRNWHVFSRGDRGEDALGTVRQWRNARVKLLNCNADRDVL